jgi:hypothetical protein
VKIRNVFRNYETTDLIYITSVSAFRTWGVGVEAIHESPLRQHADFKRIKVVPRELKTSRPFVQIFLFWMKRLEVFLIVKYYVKKN